MKDVIHVVIFWKLRLHHVILQLQHSSYHVIKNGLENSSLLRMHQLIVDRLQLSEDLKVADIEHSHALKKHNPVPFWTRRLRRQLFCQQAAQLQLGSGPHLIVCPGKLETTVWSIRCFFFNAYCIRFMYKHYEIHILLSWIRRKSWYWCFV